MNIKETLKKVLDFFGFLSEDERISITNISVIIFLTIVSFKSLFGGLEITFGSWFTWKVQEMDLVNTLPLLYSLLNYQAKRTEVNKMKLQMKEKENNEING